MEREILSKNEYIALELTRIWCNQPLDTVNSQCVIDVYKKYLKNLNEEEN